MYKLFVAFVLFSLLFLACEENQEETSMSDDQNSIVEFKERKIDLKPYFEGFPYMEFHPSYKAGKIFYMQEGDTREFKSISLNGELDLTEGIIISDIDYSKRNVWSIRYRENDGHIYWLGDEINDEVMNIYDLDPETKTVKKLTDQPYIFGWRWDNDAEQIAYVARLGTKNERLGELRILDLKSSEDKAIVQDIPELRFSWASPSWHPDKKGVLLVALKDADRNYGNLVWVDIEKQTMKLLTDSTIMRRYPEAYPKWLNENEFLYSSNESGYTNIHKYNISTDEMQQLTNFKVDLGGYTLIKHGEKNMIFAVVATPIESRLMLIDPQTGETLINESTNMNYTISDSDSNKVLMTGSSVDTKFILDEVVIDENGFTKNTILELPQELKNKIMNAVVEKIEFPTFDIDDKTGDTRKLHGYLYKPKDPLPKEDQMVLIQSFYGGYNGYHARTQILTEAGLYVLSPAPRGSSGYGYDFMALNDKDLGGNEIIDIIYAAKWCQENLGIPPERIGVFGGSHGGYATMRLLSFPGEINGNTEDFDFGFGISHAGFSDIIHFYETCNIPDWVLLEAGDPKTESDKLKDRSPLYNAPDFSGKLLLTHGTNDSRVPIEGSRWMADSLKKYNKPFELIEFEGQGHGIKGLENNVNNFKVWFEFLSTIDK